MAEKSSESKPKVKVTKTGSKGSMDMRPGEATKVKRPAEVKVATTVVAPDSPTVNAVVSAKAEKKPSRFSRSLVIKVVAAIVAVVVVIVAVFAVLIYVFSSTSQLTYAVTRVIPYPAERVNGHFVTYHDYLFEVNANQKAYVSNAKLNNQTAVSWGSADGKKLLKQIKQHALTKLEDDAITAQLASKYKVTVSKTDVNNLINTLYQKYGGKDTLLKTLSQIYGWSLNDLRHVVTGQLLSQKVQAKVTADPAIDAQNKAKAQSILAKLTAGADFAATAKQYSQASDASNGGDLGVVAKGQVEDAVYTAAAALQAGQTSGVVKTQYGYQIIKVIDTSAAGIHMQHILIENVNYTSYFSTQEKAAKVHTYVKV